jgi:hypothetical protein
MLADASGSKTAPGLLLRHNGTGMAAARRTLASGPAKTVAGVAGS